MTWIPVLGIALVAVGGAGMFLRSVSFVRVTLPSNHGSNPGFGAYESMVMPWFLTACVGVAILAPTWSWAVGLFVVGLFGLGFVANLLARAFGRPDS